MHRRWISIFIFSNTSSIIDELVSKDAFSILDRVGRLLDDFPEDLRQFSNFAQKKSWRLSAQDTGMIDPNFDELKTFILIDAQSMQKQTVYTLSEMITLIPSMFLQLQCIQFLRRL